MGLDAKLQDAEILEGTEAMGLTVEGTELAIHRDDKAWGAYYTSQTIARYMASWAIRSDDDVILEPSFGDGVFLDAVLDCHPNRDKALSNLYAIELRGDAFQKYTQTRAALPEKNCIWSDFFLVDSFPVDVVIGNPPYVRLRHLPSEQAETAMRRTREMDISMAPSGSLWMPFVAHSTSFLRPSGRLAFVLPYDLTYVQYAAPLWHYLCNHFAALTVIRVHEDMFPQNEQETVILLADGFGGATGEIIYRVFESHDRLAVDDASVCSVIQAESIVSGERPFVRELLSRGTKGFLADLRSRGVLQPLADLCKFKIGYVSGDKQFFHPSSGIRVQYALPEDNFLPAVFNSKQVKSLGIDLAPGLIDSVLYLPRQLSLGDFAYIGLGEEEGVSQRYKCRTRDPWYVTPGIEIADVILGVFADSPLMVKNSGGYAASNSLLCGYLRGDATADEILCSWYNSLTLLSIELTVHSLGGGVLIFIPGETDRIPVPVVHPTEEVKTQFLRDVDDCLRRGDTDGAYAIGDELILKMTLGLSEEQIAMIQRGVRVLRHWRNRG